MVIPSKQGLSEEATCRDVLQFFNVEKTIIDDFLTDEDKSRDQKLHEALLSSVDDKAFAEMTYHDYQDSQEKLKATMLTLHEDIIVLRKDPVLQDVVKHEQMGDVDKVVSEDLEEVATQLHTINAIIGLTLSVAALCHSPQSVISMMQSGTKSGMENAAGYVDGLAMMASGLRQFREGERGAGAVTMATGVGLTGCTMSSNIMIGIGTGSATLSAGLLGFSYVGALAVMMGMSTARMIKARNRKEEAEKAIETLTEQLSNIDDEVNALVDTLETKQAELKKHDVISQQEKQDLPETGQGLFDLYEQKEKLRLDYLTKQQEIEAKIAALSENKQDEKVNAIKLVHLEEEKKKAKSNYIQDKETYEKKIKAHPVDDKTEALLKRYEKLNTLREEIGDLDKKKSKKIDEKKILEKKLDDKTTEKFKQAAKEKDHTRAAKGFAAATIALGALATVSFLTLSGVSFGALPAATIVLTVSVLAINYLRHRWASNLSHTSKLAESKALNLISLRKMLKNHQCGIDLDKPISFSNTGIDKAKNTLLSKKSIMTFRAYFDELILNDPMKAKSVMEAYQKNDVVTFKKALSQKRSVALKGREKEFYHGIINTPASGKALAKAYQNSGRQGLIKYLHEKKQKNQSQMGILKKLGNAISEKTGIKAFRRTGLKDAELAAFQFLETNPERLDVLMHEYTKERAEGNIDDLAKAVEGVPTYHEKTTGIALFKASQNSDENVFRKPSPVLKQKQTEEGSEDEGESREEISSKDDSPGMGL